MARKDRKTFIAVMAMIVFLVSVYHHQFSNESMVSVENLRASPFPLYPQTDANYAIQEEDEETTHQSSRHVTSVAERVSAVSILLPAWEVLVIVSPRTPPSDSAAGLHTCVFPNNDSSLAKPAGILPFPDRMTYKCELPPRLRRRMPFPQPVLTDSPDNLSERKYPAPELMWWNFLVYDSLSTENDVILFVKGLNNRQGVNRAPDEFRCVFSDGVKTAVTSSIQEVFRCERPGLSAAPSSGPGEGGLTNITLEISKQNLLVPSVAYYKPTSKVAPPQPKALLCACTMVYNVAKFLREWVVYHSEIGIEKFILYDNGSDDELESVVAELVQQGYNLSTLFWLWPKTQEAGFSHCAVYANDSCTWMMYIDVDEFVYSPSWLNSSNPSDNSINSLLPNSSSPTSSYKIGQVMINCNEFGPSNQKSHPVTGVTQGYNCRRQAQNRHKSIVLLEAIDESLVNVIHHFQLRAGYRARKLSIRNAIVNHYKFQAWSEFKTKFRRRVSAYVVDWTKAVNPASKDRAPGLGYVPVEPQGWPEKFCEVYDNRLKDLTRRWFGIKSASGDGYQMAWQR